MDPITIGAGLASIAGPILGGLFGDSQAEENEKKALDAKLQALKAIQDVKLPEIEEQKLALAGLASQGELTPEMVETIQQGDSEMKGISTDPRLKAAQMQALTSLQEQGNQGLTAEDRASLMQINRGVAADAAARDQTILQSMAQKGMGGSGAELAMRLQESQSAGDRAMMQGNQVASQAQQKALQAIAQAGALAGQQQGQEFNQKAMQAQAQDAIARFNAQNRQAVASTNVASRNDAQKYNLGEKQRIADTNVGLSNQQQVHNKGLYQQRFNNELNKANAAAGQQGQVANEYSNQAQRTRDLWSGVGQGVGEGALAVGGYLNKKDQKFAGGLVEGKANAPGDSPENDTVDTVLSPGEVVLPRSIVNSNDDDVILSFVKAVKKK